MNLCTHNNSDLVDDFLNLLSVCLHGNAHHRALSEFIQPKKIRFVSP